MFKDGCRVQHDANSNYQGSNVVLFHSFSPCFSGFELLVQTRIFHNHFLQLLTIETCSIMLLIRLTPINILKYVLQYKKFSQALFSITKVT